MRGHDGTREGLSKRSGHWSGAWFVGTLRTVLQTGGAFSLCLAEDEVASFIWRVDRTDPQVAEPRIVIVAGGASDQLLQWVRRKRPVLRVIVKIAALRANLVRDAIQGGAWAAFPMTTRRRRC